MQYIYIYIYIYAILPFCFECRAFWYRAHREAQTTKCLIGRLTHLCVDRFGGSLKLLVPLLSPRFVDLHVVDAKLLLPAVWVSQCFSFFKKSVLICPLHYSLSAVAHARSYMRTYIRMYVFIDVCMHFCTTVTNFMTKSLLLVLRGLFFDGMMWSCLV